MSKKDDSGKFWPYMILGFLFIGITLGYWTIKNTISLPVRESNAFMMKYQDADVNADLMQESAERFDSKYSIIISGLEHVEFKPKNLKRKPHRYVGLNESNTFSYFISSKDGKGVDANVSILLTKPGTNEDDLPIIKVKGDRGLYRVDSLLVTKPGRYIIRARFIVGKDIKFIDTYGVRVK